MKRRIGTALFVFVIGFTTVLAQSVDWRTYLEQLAEDSEEGITETTIENMFQELTMLESNPMNINTVTREQLERFPLLTFDQATALADFLEKNRPVYTVFELRNISRLDFNTVELILPFFVVGEPEKEQTSIAEMVKHGRSEIQFRLDKTLNKRAGYGEFSDSILQRYPNRKYRGEDFYTSLKYSFAYRDRVQFGLLGEKDAGEPFLRRNYPKGYDHYGFHLIVRNLGRIKTLAVGDYRLSFGQGLVLNNDFMLSKAWATNNIIRRTQEPKRHFSTAENGFFRGVAAVIRATEKINVTAFYSNKLFDANLSHDGRITSLKTDGYHRTAAEMDKKNNSREQVAGINIGYQKNRLRIGLSAIFHMYNRMYYPSLNEYNYYYLRSSSNVNAGIDYSYRFNRLSFAGETAIARNGAVATTNMIQYAPSNLFALSVLYRRFPISYNAVHARAISEGSRVQNESGLYVGATFSPVRKVSVTTYVDIFRFPWIKNDVDKPSGGVDAYFAGTYTISRHSGFELRYKFKQKEQNARYPDEKSQTVLPYNTQKIRLRYSNTLKSGWYFRTTVDVVLYNRKYFEPEKGFMLSQNVGYRGGGKVSGDFFAGYFKSDSFAARLYSYERNILTTFYMPSFYGKGARLAMAGRYSVTQRLSLSAKIGYTRYLDRHTIGSGNDIIDGNNRADVFTYLRWRF